MKNFINNKGITLVALVITIIILIILAGVGLSVLLGQDGLINKSRLGAFEYKLCSIEEQIMMRQDFDTNANLTLDYSKVFDGVFDPTGISASLKRDIVKEREGIKNDSDLTTELINTKYNSYLNGEEKIPEMYYVKTDVAGDATSHKYIYDTKTGVVLQVPAETIDGYEHHVKTISNTSTGGVTPSGGSNNGGSSNNGGGNNSNDDPPAVIPENALVRKLMALGDNMPSTYGYDVDYSVTITNTVNDYTFDRMGRSYTLNGTKQVTTVLDDWKLFYCDGTYAYIVPNSMVPNATIMGNEIRRIFDADQNTMTPPDVYDVETDYWVESYYEYETNGCRATVSGSKLTSSENMGTIWKNTFENANNWTQFLDGTYAKNAYGGIPMDMWLASWNSKYPSSQASISNFNNLIFNGEEFTSFSDLRTIETSGLDNYTMYFCDVLMDERVNQEDPDNNYFDEYGYPLHRCASMYAIDGKYDNDDIYVVCCDDGCVGYANNKAFTLGIRPIVRLKAETIGSINSSTGTITLGE